MKYDVTKLGERIKARREALEKKQKDVASQIWSVDIEKELSEEKKSGISAAIIEVDRKNLIEKYRKRLWTYESGSAKPEELDVFCRLCEHLDCDMNYLFGAIDYKDGDIVDCLPHPIEAVIEEQLHLSAHASSYLRIAIDSYINEKINETSANTSEFHSFEIGKKGKFLFLQHLLENPDIWEKIGVAYFDHVNEIEKARIAPNDISRSGFSHLDLADLHVSKAQSALRELFEIRTSSYYDELGIVEQK